MFSLLNNFLALKKVISAVLVTILSFGYELGLSLDFQGVHDRPGSVLTYSFYDSTRKVGKNEMIERTPSYNIHLAKDEYEACLIVIRCKYCSTVKYMDLEFTPFVNENGDVLPSRIYKEDYIPCVSDTDYGLHPDALIPVDSKYSSQVSYEINYPFYIQVQSSSDTPAGTYKAQVKAKYDHRDKYEFVADVTATVWNFELPETPASDSALGIGRGDIANFYNLTDEEEITEMYKKYYDYLLERNMSGYHLPYDILDPRADAYMSDPRVTSFMIPYPADDELLVKYYNKVFSNPVWAAKSYFYPVDEPSDSEAYEGYNACTERLDRLCPGYHMVTPANTAEIKFGKEIRYTTDLQKKSDIFCGLSKLYDSRKLVKQVEKRRAEGTDIWWYVCGGPREDYCNVFTHWDGIKARLLFWQQKDLNINGFLYWSTTYWSDVNGSPWHGAHTTPWTGPDTFGDGSLFYPGPNGPLSSMRLEELSDGFDDFDLLTMAEELFGRKYVEKKINKISLSLTDYTLDDKKLTKVRNEIGSDIEAALNS